ncbi:hypothetical protein [Comamonas sp. C24C]
MLKPHQSAIAQRPRHRGVQLADVAIALDQDRKGSIQAMAWLKRHHQECMEKGSPSSLFLREAVGPA